jgi:hypothetical protein
MLGGLKHEKKRSTARVATALSCTSAFMSVVTTEPGQQPLPGTRTAIELLASKSEWDRRHFHLTVGRSSRDDPKPERPSWAVPKSKGAAP